MIRYIDVNVNASVSSIVPLHEGVQFGICEK